MCASLHYWDFDALHLALPSIKDGGNQLGSPCVHHGSKVQKESWATLVKLFSQEFYRSVINGIQSQFPILMFIHTFYQPHRLTIVSSELAHAKAF